MSCIVIKFFVRLSFGAKKNYPPAIFHGGQMINRSLYFYSPENFPGLVILSCLEVHHFAVVRVRDYECAGR